MKQALRIGLVSLCIIVLGAAVAMADRPLCVGDSGSCFFPLGYPGVSLNDDSGNIIWYVQFFGDINDFYRIAPNGDEFFHAMSSDINGLVYCPPGVTGTDCIDWETGTPGPGSFAADDPAGSFGHANINISFPDACKAQVAVKGEVQKISSGEWFEIKIHFVGTDDDSEPGGCRNILDKIELKPLND